MGKNIPTHFRWAQVRCVLGTSQYDECRTQKRIVARLDSCQRTEISSESLTTMPTYNDASFADYCVVAKLKLSRVGYFWRSIMTVHLRDLIGHHGNNIGWEGDISSHGSTHRLAIDMGVGAYESCLHSLHSIRRTIFLKVILAIYGGRMCKNQPKFEVFQPWINTQGCYGHGTGGKWKRTSNYIIY